MSEPIPPHTVTLTPAHAALVRLAAEQRQAAIAAADAKQEAALATLYPEYGVEGPCTIADGPKGTLVLSWGAPEPKP